MFDPVLRECRNAVIGVNALVILAELRFEYSPETSVADSAQTRRQATGHWTLTWCEATT
jgi:hypothetical protein